MAKAAQSCAIRFGSSVCFETFDGSIVVGISIIEDVKTNLVGNTVFLQYDADTSGKQYTLTYIRI